MWRWPRRLGAVTCYFYWTKSGNYLITSNYTACVELVRLLEVRARLYGPPWTPGACSVGIPGTPFLPKVPEKQVTRWRGCGPSERPGPWGVPPLGSASEPEMGWFKARPAPLGLPGSPYLTSGDVGELIPQAGGRWCLPGLRSVLASIAPTSPRHPLPRTLRPITPPIGCRALVPEAGAGMCVVGCVPAARPVWEGDSWFSLAPGLPVHTGRRGVFLLCRWPAA